MACAPSPSGTRNITSNESCKCEESMNTDAEDWSLRLWQTVIDFEGQSFQTSGRGSRPGVTFRYEISRSAGASGRHYSGAGVPGYGNELWIITADGERKAKSISRSTVDLAYRRAIESGGIVKGPKALGIPGAGSYLYPVLIRFGVIRAG